MTPKEDQTETDILRRPWRTKRIGNEEYVLQEDAEAALRVLTEQLVSLRNYQYEQTRTLSGVLDRLCNVVAQVYPESTSKDTKPDDEENDAPVTCQSLN